MQLLKVTLILALSVLGSRALPDPDWFKHFGDVALAAHNGDAPPSTAAGSLDLVTYTLVDTSLFMMQLAKTGYLLLDFGLEEPIGPLFDFTHNITRVKCSEGTGCVQEDIYMEFREPSFGGVRSIQLFTDFQLDRLNLTLQIDDFTLNCPGYRHTISNNASGVLRIGEGATLALRNATYAINADYQYVPQVGIQVSNVDLTLDIGEETWTVENRFTVLESGVIIDDGLYQGDLKEGVMSIWQGEIEEGKPFEEQYEQWAEFVLNCGLSGGKSSENCDDVKDHVSKYNSIMSKK